MKSVTLKNGWKVVAEVDDDGDLNVYIENGLSNTVLKVESGRDDGNDERVALRFSIPENYL